MSESPTILRRYLSTFIDGTFILSCFIVFCFLIDSYAINSDSIFATFARTLLFFIMFFFYEPILTSRYCTIGQRIMGIRVRTVVTYERISIFSAYMRIMVKIPLGIISLLIIPFTKERRAIHDFAADSIVIASKKLRTLRENIGGSPGFVVVLTGLYAAAEDFIL